MLAEINLGNGLRLVGAQFNQLDIPAGKTIELVTDYQDKRLDWFSNNDDVSRIVPSSDKKSAKITGLKPGSVVLQIQNEKGIKLTLNLVVIEPIGLAESISATSRVSDKESL